MKLLRKILLASAIVLLAAAALVCWLPVRWALPWLQPALHGLQLDDVGGTLWQGHAGRVLAADGRVLGQVHWQLSRRALFGQVQGHLDFSGSQFELRGDFARTAPGQVTWQPLSGRADLAALAASRARLPYQVGGELSFAATRAVLQGGWPLELQGELHWQRASLHTKQGELALGDMTAQLTAQGGVIHASWQDNGRGPLQTRGTVQFSPLGWRLDATLKARNDNPALLRWLATLGRLDAQGSLHLQRRGGLLAAPNKESDAP